MVPNVGQNVNSHGEMQTPAKGGIAGAENSLERG